MPGVAALQDAMAAGGAAPKAHAKGKGKKKKKKVTGDEDPDEDGDGTAKKARHPKNIRQACAGRTRDSVAEGIRFAGPNLELRECMQAISFENDYI